MRMSAVNSSMFDAQEYRFTQVPRPTRAASRPVNENRLEQRNCIGNTRSVCVFFNLLGLNTDFGGASTMGENGRKNRVTSQSTQLNGCYFRLNTGIFDVKM